jgi:hypothetical protein
VNQQSTPVMGDLSILTGERQGHGIALVLGGMIRLEEILVVACGLSAPLGRVGQARGSIVERYVHGARGEIKISGEENLVGKWRCRVYVTRFGDLGESHSGNRGGWSSWATLMDRLE